MNTFFDNIVYKGVPFDIVQPNDCPEGLENPTLRLHTYGDDSVVVNYTLSGDMVTIHIGATDLDVLDDGVIYYEWANSESAITCNNTVYTLKTPEGYDPISIEDIYESGYTSGHTAGMEDQKDLMVEADIVENGTYTRPDGYSTVNVNVGTSGSVVFTSQSIFDYRNTFYTSGTPWSALTVDAQQFGDEQYSGGYNYALNNIDVESVQLSVSANGEYDAVIGPGGAGYIKKVIVDVPSSGVSTPYFGKVAYFDERNVYGERFNNAFRSNISNFNSVGDYIKIGFGINCEEGFWFTETDGSLLGWLVQGSYDQVSGGTIYISNAGNIASLSYDINDELFFTLTITGVTENTRDAIATLTNKTKGISTSLSGITHSNYNNLGLAIGSDEEDFDTYISYWSLYSYEIKTSQNHHLILPRSDMKFWDVINDTEVDVTTAYTIFTEFTIDDDGHIGEVSTPYFMPKYPWEIV